MATAAPLTTSSEPTDEVVVHLPATRRRTWHADPRCPRAGEDLVPLTARVEHLPELTWSQHRSLPCTACARGVLIDIAVRCAGEDPANRVLLACPRLRFVDPAWTHVGCDNCARLAQLGHAHGLPVRRSERRRVVLAAPVVPALERVVRLAFAMFPVPDTVGEVTPEGVTLAWANRSPQSIAGFISIRNRITRLHETHVTPAWDLLDVSFTTPTGTSRD